MLLGFVGRGGGWGVSIDDDRAVEGLWWRGMMMMMYDDSSEGRRFRGTIAVGSKLDGQ